MSTKPVTPEALTAFIRAEIAKHEPFPLVVQDYLSPVGMRRPSPEERKKTKAVLQQLKDDLAVEAARCMVTGEPSPFEQLLAKAHSAFTKTTYRPRQELVQATSPRPLSRVRVVKSRGDKP